MTSQPFRTTLIASDTVSSAQYNHSESGHALTNPTRPSLIKCSNTLCPTTIPFWTPPLRTIEKKINTYSPGGNLSLMLFLATAVLETISSIPFVFLFSLWIRFGYLRLV